MDGRSRLTAQRTELVGVSFVLAAAALVAAQAYFAVTVDLQDHSSAWERIYRVFGAQVQGELGILVLGGAYLLAAREEMPDLKVTFMHGLATVLAIFIGTLLVFGGLYSVWFEYAKATPTNLSGHVVQILYRVPAFILGLATLWLAVLSPVDAAASDGAPATDGHEQTSGDAAR